jgi:taurine dioxygenase
VSSLVVRPLSDALGVQVTGIDLRDEQPDDVRRAVVDAWLEHHLVLVPDQDLQLEDQLRFCRWFGPLRPPAREVHPDLPADALHSHLSNSRVDGTGGTADVMRHQDFTWTVPLRGLCLYAIEVPDTGGDTVFYNAEAALRHLPPAVLTGLEGLTAIHIDRYAASREDRRNPGAGATATIPQTDQPVVLTHPRTGRHILFVDEQTTSRIIGLSDDDGDRLLQRLLASFDEPAIRYTHRWRVGDVVVWDNLSLQHSRTSFPADQRRTLRRVQID